ncbi:FAD/FMN-containing isoamyl alcohol oxidase MreA-like, putative [Cordyceps militaris CM01]|uniref:FAD/FMN-containing isoamyl alcohol oxidase MreA-like, putative n=1 Tax=Cordyceps militaris (strain CM01) TaxID=983644 RepID=G3J9V3_CORMM|nr:FAD/FMN-containing isoamyl alcohol oxidase MreA-like, putative [Cordyceps militaris CM01]EGX94176.1 FAD/FMN-containing isoamyl alcohol oxidase MreA-like, putative [Cordyceps militaris CM01]
MKLAKFVSITVFLGAAYGATLQTRTNASQCRCKPSEPCWPSQNQWASLNASVSGNLVALQPVAHVCHDPGYDAAACNASMALTESSVWRDQNPGAVQWTNWEAWPERSETCSFDLPRDVPCRQGRIPLFSVVAETAQHIQEAVRFAATHNVRLAIKNTGHCFLGRSSAPESLQIATYKMNKMDFVDKFVPEGAHSKTSMGSAVTLGAGVVLMDIYAETSKRNLTAVVGLSHTVGAAGGYIQGGGHSPLGPWKGMASDNALQFRVVTADGKLVVANEYQNRDLFWALRGGGGGTFGVVVDVTIRTFPDVPALALMSDITLPGPADDRFWDTLAALHRRLPALADAGGSGYYFFLPNSDQNGAPVASITILMFFPDKTDKAPVAKIADAFIQEARKSAPSANYTLELAPTLGGSIAYELAQTPYDPTGGIAILGSRMISRNLLSQTDGAQRLSKALRDIYEGSGNKTGYTGHFIADGAVARNDKIKSALNPAWRKTITHIVFSRDWAPNATLAEQRAVQEKLTNVEVPILKALEEGMGAYLNEADPFEADFQQSFWGENYKRLYRIKQHVDPKGLFIARSGVGSEDWDADGLCRVRKPSTGNLSQLRL